MIEPRPGEIWMLASGDGPVYAIVSIWKIEKQCSKRSFLGYQVLERRTSEIASYITIPAESSYRWVKARRDFNGRLFIPKDPEEIPGQPIRGHERYVGMQTGKGLKLGWVKSE